MKLFVVLAFCFLIVSQIVVCDIVKGTATGWRYPTATVSCPYGKTLSGGGGHCISLGGVGWTFVKESYPSSETEWVVQCDTPEQQNIKVEAFAVCH